MSDRPIGDTSTPARFAQETVRVDPTTGLPYSAAAPESTVQRAPAVSTAAATIASGGSLSGAVSVAAGRVVRGGATGLIGRLVRVEARLASFDRLKERGAGVVMAAGVFLAVLWWMAKDRLAGLLQLSG